LSNAYERRVWRDAGAVSALIAVAAIVAGTVLRDGKGFWGATLGATVVVIFFVVHLIVSAVTKEMDPISTMALAMFAYFAKIFALAGFLIAFRNSTFLDRTTFGATAILVTAGWLAAEIRAFTKTRFILNEGPASPGGSHE
jgi:ATP synthase protein I